MPAGELKHLLGPMIAKLRKDLRRRLLAARGAGDVVRDVAAAHLQRSLSLAAALRRRAAARDRRDASALRFLGRRFALLRGDCRAFVADDVERAVAGLARVDLVRALVDRHSPWLGERAVVAALTAFALRRAALVRGLQRGLRQRLARRVSRVERRKEVHEREDGRIDRLRAVAARAHDRQQRTRDAYRLPARAAASRGSELGKQARAMLRAARPRGDFGDFGDNVLLRPALVDDAPPWAKPVAWAKPLGTPPKVRVLPTPSIFNRLPAPRKAPPAPASPARVRVSRSSKTVRFAADVAAPNRLVPLPATTSRPGSSWTPLAKVPSAGAARPGALRPMSGVDDPSDRRRFETPPAHAARPPRRLGDVPLLGT